MSASPSPAEPGAPATTVAPPEDHSPVVGRAREILVSLRWPLAAYLASRVLVLGALVASARYTGSSVWAKVMMWDASWYVAIAEKGYPKVDPYLANFDFGNVAAHPAFFPLYPATIRWTSWLTGLSPVTTAAALSTVFGAVAASLLWLLARRLTDEATATRTVVLFVFFPGAFIFSVAYSEALMLVFATACLLFLVERRWLAAGLAAAAATATRPNAGVLVLCCAWAAAVAVHHDRDWRALLAPALAPLGVAGYFAFLWLRMEEPLTWFIVQRAAWHESISIGRSIAAARHVLGFDGPGLPDDWIVFGGLAFVLVAGALMAWWRPPAVLVIYTTGMIGLALTAQTLGARPRFVLTAFPLILAVARVTTGWRHQALVGASAGLLAVVTVVYAAVDPALGVP